MGGFFSRIMRLATLKEETRVLMLGLDGAGKTSTLYKLKLGEVVTTIPTIGFNVETVEYRNLQLAVWDVGGQKKIRVLWHHYFRGANAIIYVLDSSDVDRVEEAREELMSMLDSDELASIPLLVYANKQDMPRALSPAAVAAKLDMAKLRGREWHVQGCSALTGDGLYEGLDWLAGSVMAAAKRRSSGGSSM